MPQIRRILFASDFSKASGKAFTTALMMAQAHRATLTILHVIVPPMPVLPEQYFDAATWEQIDRQARQWSQQQLHKLTEKAKKTGIRAVGLVLEGDAARQIADAARSERADLLVVGTHGRTGLARFFVGSVASRLVATASCPVVTVRSQ